MTEKSEKTYSTKKTAEMVGMSISQIHYYDHLGIIPFLKRSDNGYRCFTAENIVWLKEMKVFVDSGMTLKDIKRLTDLILIGKKATHEQQMKIVDTHIETLIQKRNEIDEQIESIHHFFDVRDQFEKEQKK